MLSVYLKTKFKQYWPYSSPRLSKKNNDSNQSPSINTTKANILSWIYESDAFKIKTALDGLGGHWKSSIFCGVEAKLFQDCNWNVHDGNTTLACSLNYSESFHVPTSFFFFLSLFHFYFWWSELGLLKTNKYFVIIQFYSITIAIAFRVKDFKFLSFLFF